MEFSVGSDDYEHCYVACLITHSFEIPSFVDRIPELLDAIGGKLGGRFGVLLGHSPFPTNN